MLGNGDILLRAFRPDDREALQRLADNEKIACRLDEPFPHPYSLADADAWIAVTRDETPRRNFAIEWRDGLAGACGFTPGAGLGSGTARMGYWVGEPFWGHGIATGAAALLWEYILHELLYVRAEAHVFAGNTASGRVLEKCGFRLEGVLRKAIRKNGVILDLLVYGKLRNEADAETHME